MFSVSDRLKYLQSLAESSGEDSSTNLHLSEWMRKNYAVGEIFFVKRRFWKNADGFSTNKKKKWHPGVVTIPSKKGTRRFYLVPGTTSKRRGYSDWQKVFCPGKKIKYSKTKYETDESFFVLKYWGTVSRKDPFEIGKLDASDAVLLQDKMIEVHKDEYIRKAYGEE
jgi:hypothetical protein